MRAQPRTCTAAHICTGTALAPAHICTGTALAPATLDPLSSHSLWLARARYTPVITVAHPPASTRTRRCAHAGLGLAWRSTGSREATSSAVGRRMCTRTRACWHAACWHAAGARPRSNELGRLLRARARGISAIRHAWVCRADRAGAKPVGRIRASPSLQLSPHATSARGLGSPPRRLHRDWAHPMPRLHGDWAHRSGVCAGTGLSPRRLHRDWAHPMPMSALGLGSARGVCAGTGVAYACSSSQTRSSGPGRAAVWTGSRSRAGAPPNRIRTERA